MGWTVHTALNLLNTFFAFNLELIRTGGDPHEEGAILQVMPWPIYRNMSDRDILAISTYLRRFHMLNHVCVALLVNKRDKDPESRRRRPHPEL